MRSVPDEDRVRSGVDDVGQPRGVAGAASRLPGAQGGVGDGVPVEQPAVERLHEPAGGDLIDGPQARDERGGARLEERPGEPAKTAELLPRSPDLAGVEDNERPRTRTVSQ